jgi:glycerol uptake facilitator-like aquaporin
MKTTLARRVVAEFLGTAFLVATVIGSGVMADRLANGNVALALLANTIATGAALVALILTFSQISGAHFNPVVTLMDALEKGLPWAETPYYVVGQVVGGIAGGRCCTLDVCAARHLFIASRPKRTVSSFQ